MKYGQRLLAYARSILVRGKSAICIDLEKGWPRLGPVRASAEARSTDSERKSLNKEILELTKALTVTRNNKIEWHSRLKMDVSQLCDRRNDEIKRQADLARWRQKEEKHQKLRARANKPKTISDRHI